MFTKHKTVLAPSLLAGNHANLESSAHLIESFGLTWAHLDIMDGHFVPNLTFGPQTLVALRQVSSLFFDVHLMLDQPDRFIEAFIQAGAGLVTIHVEPDYPVSATLTRIRQMGCQCGVALNPGTSVDAVIPYLGEVDLVLAMTVQPGFGGQPFRTDVLEKIATLDRLRSERSLNYRIEVDGGVDLSTGARCMASGADTLVAGTAFFKALNKVEFIEQLTR
ncbi:MAG: ribulose-phosphate 3-epimerase [Verrucomicrobiota bacterium]|nr:ribulose-phosphate 3-epimerase [Verrucomicrobiota bacterium]